MLGLAAMSVRRKGARKINRKPKVVATVRVYVRVGLYTGVEGLKTGLIQLSQGYQNWTPEHVKPVLCLFLKPHQRKHRLDALIGSHLDAKVMAHCSSRRSWTEIALHESMPAPAQIRNAHPHA
jgi:hypothetical protein